MNLPQPPLGVVGHKLGRRGWAAGYADADPHVRAEQIQLALVLEPCLRDGRRSAHELVVWTGAGAGAGTSTGAGVD